MTMGEPGISLNVTQMTDIDALFELIEKHKGIDVQQWLTGRLVCRLPY